MTNETQARRYLVSGCVQGVGFRNFVEHTAEKIGLDGYVRNRRDGRVEVLAIGTAEQLAKLRAELQRGPLMSRVSEVAEEPAALEPKYHGNFIIEVTDE